MRHFLEGRKWVARERKGRKEGRKASQLTVEKALSPLGNTAEVAADLAIGEQRAKQ